MTLTSKGVVHRWSAVSGNGGRIFFGPHYLAIFSIFLCVLVRYFFYAIVILLPLSIIMPNKSKSSSKMSSAEAVEGCEDAEFASVSVIRELLQSQERMFKNFVDSIAANLTKRVDDLVTKIAHL